MRPWQIWFYFFRLGLTGFGGPMAIIAQIQLDLIERQQLMDPGEFRASLSMIKSMPGPVATQVIAFVCYRLFGVVTAIISNVAFILPAAVMMVLLAMYDSDIHSIAWVNSALVGMGAAAFVLIAAAIIPLVKGYERKIDFWFFVLLSFAMIFVLHLSEPIVIVVMALLALLWDWRPRATVRSLLVWELFLICLKAGGLAFGTGLAIVPMLQGDFVNRYHWITNSQFMDALAFGQLTPGPISVTVTYVGYKLAGIPGAVIATVGIYLPGIFNMVTWFPRVFTLMRRQKWVSAVVRGAIAAIVAGIANALFVLHDQTPWQALLLAAIAWGVAWKWRLPSWSLVLSVGVIWLTWTSLL